MSARSPDASTIACSANLTDSSAFCGNRRFASAMRKMFIFTANHILISVVSLECVGLTPLWSRSGVSDNKAASSRRTPRRRPNSKLPHFGRQKQVDATKIEGVFEIHLETLKQCRPSWNQRRLAKESSCHKKAQRRKLIICASCASLWLNLSIYLHGYPRTLPYFAAY